MVEKVTREELDALVARAEVAPGPGRAVPAGERVQVWLVGATNPHLP